MLNQYIRQDPPPEILPFIRELRSITDLHDASRNSKMFTLTETQKARMAWLYRYIRAWELNHFIVL